MQMIVTPSYLYAKMESEKNSLEELQAHVLRMAGFLAFHGVVERDVVAAYMPNTAETVISMLAAVTGGNFFVMF